MRGPVGCHACRAGGTYHVSSLLGVVVVPQEGKGQRGARGVHDVCADELAALLQGRIIRQAAH